MVLLKLRRLIANAILKATSAPWIGRLAWFLVDLVKVGSYEKEDFCRFSVDDSEAASRVDCPKYPWAALPKTWENLLERQSPMIKFYRSPTPRVYPDIECVLQLFRCAGQRPPHPSGVNLLLLFVANYWTQSFFHVHKEGDVLHSLLPRQSGPGARPIYGATLDAEKAVRTGKKGLVRLSPQDLPLFVEDVRSDHPSVADRVEMPSPDQKPYAFLSGIDRVNLSVGHYLLQTLLLRNHNWICSNIDCKTDEEAFQTAKALNLWQMIRLVVGPYISAIAGAHAYAQRDIDPSLGFRHPRDEATLEFWLVYQWHAMLPDKIADVPLQDLVYKPQRFTERGVGDWLKAAANTPAHELKLQSTPDFLLPAEKAALLAQRSAGILSYCEFLRRLHLPVPSSFEELTGTDRCLAGRLREVYGDVESVEFYVGIMASPRDPDRPEIFNPVISKILSIVAIHGLARKQAELREYLGQRPDVLAMMAPSPSLDDFIRRNLSVKEKEELGDIKLSFVVA
jgi:hypothetical protein